MNKRTVDGFTRISKRAAEKRYNAGEVVILCPVKLRPGFPFFLKSRYNGKSFPRSAMSWGELADAAGESDPAAVVLFKFTGWSRCPEYERAV